MFTTTKLVNHRVLVSGTDTAGTQGSTVVDSSQWDEIQMHTSFNEAQLAFDDAVEEFFAPITEATEALAASTEVSEDDLNVWVVKPGADAVPGTQGVAYSLTQDSKILRLIEEGNTDRLIWVDGDLEILAHA